MTFIHGAIYLYDNKRDYYSYTKAYIEAYKILLNGIGENHPNDYSYYPAIFILSHIIELSVKDLASVLGVVFKNNHSLNEIWKELKPKLLMLKRFFSNEVIDMLNNAIVELTKVEKHYMVFRYPDMHPSKEESLFISHLVLEPKKIDSIAGLTYEQLIDVEKIIIDLKRLDENMTIFELDCLIDEISGSNFKSKKCSEGISCLISQYYKIDTGKKIKPKFCSIKDVGDAIKKYIKSEDNSELYDCFQKMNLCKFQDLCFLVELGRGSITLIDYHLKNSKTDFVLNVESRDSLLPWIIGKPLDKYLANALKILGY